jgi:hypothetical protein
LRRRIWIADVGLALLAMHLVVGAIVIAAFARSTRARAGRRR